jgi:ATP-dependent DNA helicase RecG
MVKIFDHHYVVESPGILPGLVRIDNIRQMHFSRNPKIAEFMQQYKLVKEFGEGVDRMFREMAEAGNPAPEYKQVEFMVKVKLTSALRDEDETGENNSDIVSDTVNVGVNAGVNERVNEKVNEKVNERQKLIISAIFENPYITQTELAKTLGISVVHVNKNMKKLQEQGIIRRVGPDKGGHWEVIEQNQSWGRFY